MADNFSIFTPRVKRKKPDMSTSPINDGQLQKILSAIEASRVEMKEQHELVKQSCDNLREKVEKLEKSVDAKVTRMEDNY